VSDGGGGGTGFEKQRKRTGWSVLFAETGFISSVLRTDANTSNATEKFHRNERVSLKNLQNLSPLFYKIL
jgi:hypothetical protein